MKHTDALGNELALGQTAATSILSYKRDRMQTGVITRIDPRETFAYVTITYELAPYYGKTKPRSQGVTRRNDQVAVCQVPA
jgi:hypothetical protein